MFAAARSVLLRTRTDVLAEGTANDNDWGIGENLIGCVPRSGKGFIFSGGH